MVIAYFDLVDSCKQIDIIISDITKFEALKNSNLRSIKQDILKKKKNQNSNIKSSTGFAVLE